MNCHVMFTDAGGEAGLPDTVGSFPAMTRSMRGLSISPVSARSGGRTLPSDAPAASRSGAPRIRSTVERARRSERSRSKQPLLGRQSYRLLAQPQGAA